LYTASVIAGFALWINLVGVFFVARTMVMGGCGSSVGSRPYTRYHQRN
jgi:hypothetical protein